MISRYLTLRSSARHNESVVPTGTWGGQGGRQSIQWSIQTLEVTIVRQSPPSTSHSLPLTLCLLSPFSCGCVLEMIHLTRQHFIRAFRENRGFCHFPESFTLPGAGSTPLASPSRLPSTTLPSTWRKEEDREARSQGGREESSGQYGNETNEVEIHKTIWLVPDLGVFQEHFREVYRELSSACLSYLTRFFTLYFRETISQSLLFSSASLFSDSSPSSFLPAPCTDTTTVLMMDSFKKAAEPETLYFYLPCQN